MTNQLRELIQQHSKPLDPIATGCEAKLQRLPGIRAVLFDVYGTLLISGSGDVGTLSENRKESSFSEALSAAGITFRGDGSTGISQLVAAIEKSHADSRADGIEFPEVDIVAIWKHTLSSLASGGMIDRREHPDSQLQRLAVEYELRSNPVWPMPTADACLQALSESEIMLGLISNAQFFTPIMLNELLGGDKAATVFDGALQFFSYEHQQAKPGRYLYELARDALSQRGVSASETLFVGNDMLNDIFPAHQVGFRTALFAGDERSLRMRSDDARTVGLVPDLVITELGQLPNCVLSTDC